MRSPIRFAMAVAGLALSFGCGAAMAATPPSTGLGQAWPNAVDASTSPNYHVYVFERHGVRYVQVNDAAGVVRAAVQYTATGNPDTTAISGLPIGSDSANVVTPTEGTLDPAQPAGEPVYSDDTVTVTASKSPAGTVTLLAVPVDCKNPAECSVRGP
jgi:hypothetical protein